MQYILVVVKISWLITSGLNYFEIWQEGMIFDISDERRTTKNFVPYVLYPVHPSLTVDQNLRSSSLQVSYCMEFALHIHQQVTRYLLQYCYVSYSIYIIKYISDTLNNVFNMCIEIELVYIYG